MKQEVCKMCKVKVNAPELQNCKSILFAEGRKRNRAPKLAGSENSCNSSHSKIYLLQRKTHTLPIFTDTTIGKYDEVMFIWHMRAMMRKLL